MYCCQYPFLKKIVKFYKKFGKRLLFRHICIIICIKYNIL